jgi:hypothetical protein
MRGYRFPRSSVDHLEANAACGVWRLLEQIVHGDVLEVGSLLGASMISWRVAWLFAGCNLVVLSCVLCFTTDVSDRRA